MIIDQTSGYGGQLPTVLAHGHVAAYIVSSLAQSFPGSVDVSRAGPGDTTVARAGPGDTTWTRKES